MKECSDNKQWIKALIDGFKVLKNPGIEPGLVVNLGLATSIIVVSVTDMKH